MRRTRAALAAAQFVSMPQKLIVRNRTRGTVLVENGLIAADLWSRFKGLMGKQELPPGFGLLLKNESAIHTFGMRIPIDVVYLDARGTVLRADKAMPPSRLGPLVRGARNVLELPVGTVETSQTSRDDVLDLDMI